VPDERVEGRARVVHAARVWHSPAGRPGLASGGRGQRAPCRAPPATSAD
jgi:hypothetical protein